MSYIGKRRSPYPYHIKISGQGFLMGSVPPGGAGSGSARSAVDTPQLASSKAQDLSAVVPPDYGYAGTNPLTDREEPYESLTLGMGLKTQEKWQDYRYAYAEAVDLSVWPWCKGPQITLFTPPTHDVANGVQSFFELGGALYCAQGQYILVRTNDSTWGVAKDFGGGVRVLNTAVFTSNYDGVRRVFVALSSGPAQWSSNGTTWTAMASFTALAFVAIGREWWWADDTNRLRKCDTNADPTNEANYTSLIFRAGDKGSPIVNLIVTAGGTLLIAKTDGLYTLDGAGDDHMLFPFLRFAPDVNNGRYYGQFENYVYIAYGTTFGRVGPDLSWQEIGPEKLVTNDSPVRGRVTGLIGLGDLFAYAAFYNPDTLTSYLGKFGAWASQNLPANATEAVHVDAWHASISHPFTSRAIQALFVSAVGSNASGHTRTYIGFSDGTIGWLLNPCVPNPAACSAYLFDVGDSFVELPIWHATYHASVKSVRHAMVTGMKLDANNYVTLEYKLDPSATSWTDFGNVFDTSSYEEAPFPNNATAVQAQFRVHLHNTAATASPLVSAFSIGHALRPKRYMQVQASILCADGLVRRDGVPMRLGRKKIRELVEAAVDTPGAVECIMPDETRQWVSWNDYSITQSFDEIGRQWRGSLSLKGVQWSLEQPV